MILIVGLGNPGIKYKRTRHNIGFRVLDKFQKENDFPDFKFSKKSNSLISKKNTGKEEIILSKSETFMNNSGQTVKKLTTYYSIPFTSLIIVHDDIDLLLGKMRISKNKGSAGHKGVESIIKELGSKNFVRLRIGIKNQKSKVESSEKFVLKNFTKKEEEIVEKIIKESCSALKMILSQGLEKAMNEFNKND